jgi:hypothetical protein
MNAVDRQQNKEKYMNKFVQWYNNNYTQITWFIIGFLLSAGLTDLSRGDYTGAIISFGIVALNYMFAKK